MSTRRTYICLTCTATSLSYPLSLHDALPIFLHLVVPVVEKVQQCEKILFINGIIKLFCEFYGLAVALFHPLCSSIQDRKSTRLNSSHVAISYAVFCLKKKNEGKQDEAMGE